MNDATSSDVDPAPPQAIILAAGKGTRMGADKPKVVQEVAGRPMIHWVVRACRQAGVARCIIVVGYKGEQVREVLGDDRGLAFVEQREQLGTGHAPLMAEPLFEQVGPCDVLILNGDGPLIRAVTLERILAAHRTSGAAETLATSVLQDPYGYGRILRDADDQLLTIVEEGDCLPEQKAIKEVNPNYVCVRSDMLFDALHSLGRNNAQGEYLLTDMPGVLMRAGHRVSLVPAVPPEDVFGINTPEELKTVDQILRRRLARENQCVAASWNES